MNVAQTIAAFLAEKGVRHAFGIIGAGNAALLNAIAALGKTEIVCSHHEAAAVMEATYYGRAIDSVGVAIVTTGAGSSNAITGALAANMDSAPVLILSGNEPSRYLGGLNRVAGVQGFNTGKAVRHFVKHSSTYASHPSEIAWILDDTWNMAFRGRKGAVWLDIPRDVFNALV